jgi:PKD repeat protein
MANAGAGDDDIDGGFTRLVSPTFDVNAYADPYVSYYRWFFNDGGSSTPNDYMTVRITNGTDTVLLENITLTANSWVPKQYRIADYLTPSATMKLIVEAADLNPGHLVEGGFDVFRAWDSIVPPAAPVADFTSNTQTICPGDIITFTDLSTDDPATWQWTFTGGIPASSTAQNPQITYLNAGSYSATLIVANGVGADTIAFNNYITVREAPTATSTATSPTCVGGTDGSASLTASGNFGPFVYEWNNGDTSNIINGLSLGTYTATVTDASGCTAEVLVDIEDPAPINIQVQSTPLTATGAADGTATVTVINGSAPYTYVWSTTETTDSISGLVLGQYQVTVTDANGCTGSATFIIDLANSISNTLEKRVNLYPNPFTSAITIDVPAVSNPSTQIRIYAVTGQLLESHIGIAPFKTQLGMELPAGIYFVEIAQGSEKAIMKAIKTNR